MQVCVYIYIYTCISSYVCHLDSVFVLSGRLSLVAPISQIFPRIPRTSHASSNFLSALRFEFSEIATHFATSTEWPGSSRTFPRPPGFLAGFLELRQSSHMSLRFPLPYIPSTFPDFSFPGFPSIPSVLSDSSNTFTEYCKGFAIAAGPHLHAGTRTSYRP